MAFRSTWTFHIQCNTLKQAERVVKDALVRMGAPVVPATYRAFPATNLPGVMTNGSNARGFDATFALDHPTEHWQAALLQVTEYSRSIAKVSWRIRSTTPGFAQGSCAGIAGQRTPSVCWTLAAA